MSSHIKLENQHSLSSSFSLDGPASDLFAASYERLNTVASTALSNLPPLPEESEEFTWVELPQSPTVKAGSILNVQDLEDALFSSPTLSLLDDDVEGISNFSSPSEQELTLSTLEEESFSPIPSNDSPLLCNQTAMLSIVDLEKPLLSGSTSSASSLQVEDLPIPALFDADFESTLSIAQESAESTVAAQQNPPQVVTGSAPNSRKRKKTGDVKQAVLSVEEARKAVPLIPNQKLPIAQESAEPTAAAQQSPPQVVDAGAPNGRKRKETGDVKQAVLSEAEARKAIPLIPNQKLREMLQKELEKPSKTVKELVNKHSISKRMLTYYLDGAPAAPIAIVILPHIVEELSNSVSKKDKRQFTKEQFTEVLKDILQIKNTNTQKALFIMINDCRANGNSVLKELINESELHRQRKRLIKQFPYLEFVLRERTSEKRKADEIEAPRSSSRRKK